MPVRHGTLTANTATQLSQAGDRIEVGVTHKGNVTNPLYVRADNNAAVIAADDTYVVLPGQTRWIPRPRNLGTPSIVSLISGGAVAFEVELP